MEVKLPPDYRPSEGEEYMNPRQLEYFRRKLFEWKDDLLADSGQARQRLRQGLEREADPLDRSSLEAEQALELRSGDRQRKLVRKIDQALERIEDGSYGYCEQTGEEIGLKRLEARPIASLSLTAQQQKERREKREKERRAAGA